MIPNNITKGHLEKAIAEIDTEGVRKGRHSSTYDLVQSGKSYPPKLVISIANRFANGEELDPSTFPGGTNTEAFKLLEAQGFEVVPKKDPVAALIQCYKKRIAITRLKDEEYKWELIEKRSGQPNIEAQDFSKEVKDSNFDNLIYAMSKAVLNELAKEKPEELRILFKELFNEKMVLGERVKSFNKATLKLYRSIGGKLQHHQDERSIATYLTFHNSDKYTFYKSSFYTKYCKLIGVKAAKTNEKYAHYLELIDDLIENHIKPDEELISQVKSYLPEYYDGENHKLLAQDILYQMLDQKEETNYWVFQGNPKAFDFETALNEGLLDDWTVSAHKDKIKEGDKVIIWITGDKSGCYALAEVTSEPHVKENSSDDHLWKTKEKSGMKVDISITHNLFQSPILKQKIDSVKELKNLKVGSQGTNFSSTEEEYKAILELAENMNTRKYWLYAPGEQANKWDEFYEEGIMALGWDDLGDLSSYKSKDELELKLKELNNTTGSKKNDATANYEFVSSMSIGDIVITKRGRREYLGYGIVSSNHYFDEKAPSYNNRRKVNWKKKGVWPETGDPTVVKTFTDITKYPDYVKRLIDLIGIEQESTFKNHEVVQHPLNTILYGPPGTGKTYLTVKRAAEIVSDRAIENYSEALTIFNEHLHKQIEFITFHQNYSYEDFIQGLRPNTKTGDQLTFLKEDGVFKKIADRALKNLEEADAAPTELTAAARFKAGLDRLIDEIQDHEDNYPITDAVHIFEVEEDAFRYNGENWTAHPTGIRMKFTDLEEFFKRGVKSRKDVKVLENVSGLAKQHATYYFKVYDLILKLIPAKVSVDKSVQKQNFVIVIDEINRANISRVFGELITLIEPDKRSHGAIPLKAKLPSGDTFTVPSNLYIVGTMNTADKSIALLDIALRRRFEFEPMYPKYEIDGAEVYDADILQKINAEIIEGKGHDFQIGHAYFMGDNKDLVKRMNKKVIPLLLEYYMNDKNEVVRILTKAGLDVNKDAWPLEVAGTA